MKPVIHLRKLWIITAFGGFLGSGITIQNQAFFLIETVNSSLFSAIEGSILLGLGYLLFVYILEYHFTVRRTTE
ncbi:MAG: hypothetical protein M1129_05260 [Candidatus Thermoplasmatota archaeon]|nr:hypothetical protein [Candidatus Thermoplasmatota archaeon]